VLHVISNSHAYFFTGTDVVRGYAYWEMHPVDTIKEIKTYSLGPCTAWGFELKDVPYIPLLNIKRGSSIMLAMGEIDCRWEIPRHGKTMAGCIRGVDATIAKYVLGIIKLMNDYKVHIWGVHAPSRNEPQPCVGSCTFRTAITMYWNSRMKEVCHDLKIPFISIFDRMLAKDGLCDMQYMLDDIHLSQKVMPLALKELNGYLDAE
jgi:hypothetical protein